MRKKVVGLALLAPACLGLICGGVLLWQTYRLKKDVKAELTESAKEYLAQVARDVHSSCQAVHEGALQQNQGAMNLMERLISDRGGAALSGELISLTVVNQVTQAKETVTMPRLYLGGSGLNLERDLSKAVPVVDEVTKITGGITSTIFQRMNERGDMLRIATSVVKKDGTRATGTYIPAVDKNGDPNPVVAAVLRGESYKGRALVVDDWYLTNYKPLRDRGGRTIGMTYVGVKQEAVASLRRAIVGTKVGQTGYVFVVGGTGVHQGRYIISQGAKRDGEMIWETKDADGRLVIQDIIGKGLKLKNGEVAYEFYPWENPSQPRHEKIAAIAYFEPWDWVIGASIPLKESQKTADLVLATVSKVVLFLIVAGFVVLGSCAVFAWGFGGKMTRPLEEMTLAARRLAEGDLDQKIEHQSADEVGQLADSCREMVFSLVAKARAVERIAQGDLNVEVNLISERDTLGLALTGMKRNIGMLIEDVKALSDAAIAGQLTVRADAGRHQGDFRRIVEGINQTLDGVVGPLKMAAHYLERIAAGEIPAKVSGEYAGDFNEIKQSLNICIHCCPRTDRESSNPYF